MGSSRCSQGTAAPRNITSVLLTAVLTAWAAAPADARELAFHVVLQVTSGAGWGAAAGDIDGDGALDLAVTDDVADTLRWIAMGTGAPVAHTISSAVDGATGVVLADFDGDGDLDVAAAARDVDDVLLWTNNGTGGFSAIPITVASVSTGVTDLAAGDLDGDGDVDLVGAVTGDDLVRRWRNSNAGTTWNPGIVSDPADGVEDVELADMDEDGDLDVVAASTAGGEVEWFANNGAAAGWTATPVDTALSGPVGVAVADLDADGDPDVVAALEGSGEAAWWENTGGASTWSATPQPIGDLAAITAVGVADLDGDGDQDIAATSASFGSAAGWFEQTAPDTWLWRASDSAQRDSRRLLLADLQQDGDTDLVYPSAGNGSGIWSSENRDNRRRPRLRPEAAHDTGINRNAITDWAIGDVDGDGRADAVFNDNYISPQDDIVFLARGAAGGNPEVLAYTLDFLADVEDRFDFLDLGDVDGDGDLDLLAGPHGGSESIDIWENDGTTSLWTAQTVIADVNEPAAWEIATGDVDGDGDLDIVRFLEDLSPIDRVLCWWEQIGDPMTLAGWTRHSIDTASDASLLVREIRVGDVDADGKLDIVTAWDAFTGPIAYWRNQGGTPPTFDRRDLPLPGTRQFELADFDRDGDLDVGGEDAWWENDPAAAGDWVRHPVDGMMALSAFDLDRDGDHDLVGGSCDDATGTEVSPCWWRNETRHSLDGFFGTPMSSLGPADWLLAADFDGDGDGDVLGGPLIGFTGSHRNQGGQAALAPLDLPDFELGEGETGTLIALDLTHGGTFGDWDVELATLAVDLSADGVPVDTTTLTSLVAALEVWRDDGDGIRNAADSLVLRQTSLTAVAGRVTLVLADGDANLQQAWDLPGLQIPARLWFDAELTPGAVGTGVETLGVDFDPEDGIVVENVFYDKPLIVEREREWHLDVTIVASGPALIFADGFESGNTSAWSLQSPP